MTNATPNDKEAAVLIFSTDTVTDDATLELADSVERRRNEAYRAARRDRYHWAIEVDPAAVIDFNLAASARTHR